MEDVEKKPTEGQQVHTSGRSVSSADNSESAGVAGGDENSESGEPPESPAVEPQSESAQESACIVDGSKLILRLTAVGKQFQVDHGLRITFSSSPLKRIEKQLTYSTYQTEHANCTVVIDSGASGLRFVPILPSLCNGVVYTREGTAHVVIPANATITRLRISAPHLPTKTVNKFTTGEFYKKANPNLASTFEAMVWKNEFFFPWATLGAESGQGGLIFIRSDDSIYTHELNDVKSTCPCDVMEGRIVAWTGGIRFMSSTGWWMFRRFNQIYGSGSLWIDNGKPISNANVVLAG